MKTWLPGLVLVLLSLCPSAGRGEPADGSKVDFAADLAAIHIEAIGGRARVEALRSLRAEGATHIGGGQLSFVMWAKRPNLVRVESVGGPVRITRGYDGVNAPWMRWDDRAAVPQPAPDAEDFIRDSDFDDPFYEPAKRGVTLIYEGVVEVRGLEWAKVRADSSTGSVVLYVDDAHMLVRRDQQRVIRGKEVTEETYFSDFRPVAGVLLPHLIEVRVGNNVLHETQLDHIDPNPMLLSGFFSGE